MKINIQAPGNGNTKVLNQFITKKLNTLLLDNSAVSEADVRLKTAGGHFDDNKTCEIYLKVGAKNIFAIKKGSTFEECSSKAIRKLQEDVKKLI
jgi:hypothetical protein